jgi:hypothetical protein
VELKFYTTRKADRKKERAYKRRKKAFIQGQLAGPSTTDDDDRWLDLLITSDEDTEDG